MCVGLPAKVIKITNGTAIVDASGARREVSAELLDERVSFIFIVCQFQAEAFDERNIILESYVYFIVGITLFVVSAISIDYFHRVPCQIGSVGLSVNIRGKKSAA